MTPTPVGVKRIGIVLDFLEYLIPGTYLVDYGPAMDGLSPTYKHVMPGCSQGNTVWYLRDFATYRESVGNKTGAAWLRELAAAVASDTMQKMYTSSDGVGFFNIIFPPAQTSAIANLTVYEMRHVVDFFSVTFGYMASPLPDLVLRLFVCDVVF
jgi:hypothetical protein